MKSVCRIYNKGVSASQSFVSFDLYDLTKQIKQKIKKGEELCNFVRRMNYSTGVTFLYNKKILKCPESPLL